MSDEKKQTKKDFTWKNFLVAIWFVLGKYRKKYLFLILGLFIIQFYAVIPPLIVGKVIDFFIAFKQGDSLNTFYLYTFFIGLTLPISAYIRLGIKNLIGNLKSDVFYNIKVDGLAKLMHFSLKWHDEETVGAKFQKIQNGLKGLDALNHHFNNEILATITSFIGIIFVFIFLQPMYVLFFIFYLVGFGAILKFFYSKIQTENENYNKSVETAGGSYVESLGNILTVKALGASKAFVGRISKREEVTKIHEYRLRRLSTTMWQIFQAFNGVCYGIFIFAAGLGVVGGQLTAGAIAIFYGYIQNLIGKTTDFLAVYETVLGAKSAVGRMTKIFWDKEDESKGNKKFPSDWESLSVEHGNFSYREEDINNNLTGLNEISFNLSKHQKVGIVGKTGSGKSTLSKILMGLYRLNSGKYLIGKTNFYEIDRDEASKNITLVLQDSEMFNLTLRDNITLMSKTKPELLEKAIKISQLSEVVQKLPNGLETIIGEKGYHLSGGERQRVAIARAIYKDPQIMIFDEATSALDNKTETAVYGLLNRYLKDKTVVVIAHRISTLKNVDKIYVFDQGKIVESGEYEELYNNKNSTFAKLYRSQNKN